MPRRPNTKNIPSRLFEDSLTPVYIVDRSLTIVYANKSLAERLQLDREEIVGQSLNYVADYCPEEPLDFIQSLCPPPSFLISSASIDATHKCFGVVLPDKQTYLVQVSILQVNDDGEQNLICSLSSSQQNQQVLSTTDWLHQEIQQFRLSQSKRFNAIPFLGQSSTARKCFSQARAYALLESNVLLKGHPQSQVVNLAKSIHYSGFSDEDEPNPLLPIDCEQVDGSRLQEILIGHFQVVCGDDPNTKAYVLLMNADVLDAVAQGNLQSICDLDELNVRFISTCQTPLPEVPDFDTELAHRLSTLEIDLPEITNRVDDIPILAQHILESNSDASKTLSEELIRCLQIYPWKNDFRELEEVVTQAISNANTAEIKLNDCSHDFKMAIKALESPLPKIESVNLDRLLADIEVETIQRAIDASKGNKTNAARMLGITRARLHRKLGEADAPSENESDAG